MKYKVALLDCCDKVPMSDTHRKIVKEFLSYRAQWFGGLLWILFLKSY